jgi:hypothetical protein
MGDRPPDHPLRLLRTHQIETLTSKDAQVGEVLLPLLPVEEVRIGDRHVGHLPGGLANKEQPIGPGVRQRTQQNRIKKTEDAGVGANTQRQNEDGNQGESRGLEERAKREPEVRMHKQGRLKVQCTADTGPTTGEEQDPSGT